MNSMCFSTFEVNKTFRKKVVLLPMNKWKVAEEDSLMSGSVQCIIRGKGLFFLHTSPNQRRYINITKHGFMFVYVSEDKGYVIDLATATKIKTKTVFARGLKQTRQTRVDVKMPYGTLCMLFCDAATKGWLDAINAVVLGKKGLEKPPIETNAVPEKEKCDETTVNMRTLAEGEGVSSKSPDAESSVKLTSAVSTSKIDLPSPTTTNLGEVSIRSESPVTVIEVQPQPKLGVKLPPSLETFVDFPLRRWPAVSSLSTISSKTNVLSTEHVRFGHESAATLCQKLEANINRSWRKTRSHPTMSSHPLEPSNEKMLPRLIVRKSVSAPSLLSCNVAVPSSSRITLATFSYDGCFDSIRA